MDFSAGIPVDSAAMIVIPCMLTSHESFSKLLTSLEVCWLGNQNENICFALLTDFADAENNKRLQTEPSQTGDRRYAGA
jgi:hypothetical protein